jgi:glyoxylase-like metal-dependent hydrolase (beta-lactamase superfamily II)
LQSTDIYRIALPVPFPIATINVYLINDSPKTLIDAGIKTRVSFEALKRGIENLGLELQDIERILLTHGHIDHYGQAQAISGISGAEIFIHRLEHDRTRLSLYPFDRLRGLLQTNGTPETLIDKVVDSIKAWEDFADPVNKAIFLDDGDIIPFESMSLQAVHCPGHSPGLLCFYCREKKILFTGDQLLRDITPNPILDLSTQCPPFEYTSLKRYISSLKKLMDLDITLCFPGHGEAIDDFRNTTLKIFKHHDDRMHNILSILTTGEKTPYEISTELFAGGPLYDVFLGISEVLGHLQILKEQRKVEVQKREEKDYYSLVYI